MNARICPTFDWCVPGPAAGAAARNFANTPSQLAQAPVHFNVKLINVLEAVPYGRMHADTLPLANSMQRQRASNWYCISAVGPFDTGRRAPLAQCKHNTQRNKKKKKNNYFFGIAHSHQTMAKRNPKITFVTVFAFTIARARTWASSTTRKWCVRGEIASMKDAWVAGTCIYIPNTHLQWPIQMTQ